MSNKGYVMIPRDIPQSILDETIKEAAPALLAALIKMTQHRIMQLQMSGVTRKSEDIEEALQAIEHAHGWRIQ
jgi:hypothetical protein